MTTDRPEESIGVTATRSPCKPSPAPARGSNGWPAFVWLGALAVAAGGVTVGYLARGIAAGDFMAAFLLVETGIVVMIVLALLAFGAYAVRTLTRDIVEDVVTTMSATVTSRVLAEIKGEISAAVEAHVAEPIREVLRAYAQIKAERSPNNMGDTTLVLPPMVIPEPRRPDSRVVAVAPVRGQQHATIMSAVQRMLDEHLEQIGELLADAVTLQEGQKVVGAAVIRLPSQPSHYRD